MKVTIKGTVKSCTDARTVSNGSICELVLEKKYHDPDTGEIKSTDFFPIQFWNDMFEKYAAAVKVSKVLEVTGYLNGKLNSKDGNDKAFLSITAKEFKPIVYIKQEEG
jgi:hypothetical protein